MIKKISTKTELSEIPNGIINIPGSPKPPKAKKLQTDDILKERKHEKPDNWSNMKYMKYETVESEKNNLTAFQKMTTPLTKIKNEPQTQPDIVQKYSTVQKSNTVQKQRSSNKTRNPENNPPTNPETPPLTQDLDLATAKTHLRQSLRYYRDSNFNFEKFERNAFKHPKMVKMYEQVRKFFTANGHDAQMTSFIQNMKK